MGGADQHIAIETTQDHVIGSDAVHIFVDPLVVDTGMGESETAVVGGQALQVGAELCTFLE